MGSAINHRNTLSNKHYHAREGTKEGHYNEWNSHENEKLFHICELTS